MSTWNYFIRQLLSLLGAFVLLFVLAYILVRLVPGDPVEQRLLSPGNSGKMSIADRQVRYEEEFRKLHLHLPSFYVTVSSLALPDSFKHIPSQEKRNQLIGLSLESGRPDLVYRLREELDKLSVLPQGSFMQSDSTFLTRQFLFKQLRSQHTLAGFREVATRLFQQSDSSELTHVSLQELQSTLTELTRSGRSWAAWVPVIRFHPSNQFSMWLDRQCSTGTIFGSSLRTGGPVWPQLFNPLLLTLGLCLFSLIISVWLAIPFTFFLLVKAGPFIRLLASRLMLFMYAIPLFWLATLLLFAFANPSVLSLFPASGIGPSGGFAMSMSGWERCLSSVPYLILPLLAFVFPSWLYFSAVLQADIETEMKKDYVLTAYSKGLTLPHILQKHVLRNAIPPLFVAAISTFPVLASGSLMIERIFGLPGIGNQLVIAIQFQDYPVIVAIFLCIGMCTLVFFKVGEVIQRMLDPRVDSLYREGGWHG